MKPIHFQPETVDWLNSHDPWPDSLYEDLDQLLKHNEKYYRIKNQ